MVEELFKKLPSVLEEKARLVSQNLSNYFAH